jgi:hypothetical protein
MRQSRLKSIESWYLMIDDMLAIGGLLDAKLEKGCSYKYLFV